MYINFEDSDSYKNLVKKWGLDDREMMNHFDDLVDEGVEFYYKQGIIDYEKTPDEFKLIIILYFEYNLKKVKKISDSSYLYSFSDYNRFIKKQNDIFSLIESSVKRFISAEKLNIEFDGTGISNIPFYMLQDERKNKLRVNYKLSLLINSPEVNKEYKKFISNKNPLSESKDKLVMSLIRGGINQEFAEDLLDVHPGYLTDEVVLFGFNTDDEIIIIATFDKETGSLNIDKNEFRRALEYFYNGYCAEILGDYYLEENEN
jgi:hypothetical protein